MVNGKTAFELRCATADGASMQDVLPRVRTPSGTTYQWTGNGSWQALPDAPAALMGIWSQLLNEKHDHTPSVQRSSEPRGGQERGQVHPGQRLPR